METKLLMIVVQKLSDEVELLKKQLSAIANNIDEIKSSNDNSACHIQTNEDELLNTDQVLKLLGICYVSLQKVIRNGELTPIRINQRRIRFTKLAVMEFIRKKQRI